jgi:uncharacterized membrane protein YphA (DoxX/SURF4 family)
MTGLSLFSPADSRIRWLRVALIAAMLSGMLCSLPLWLSTRAYPFVPLLPAGLMLPPALGPLLLGLTLLSLVAATRCFRPAITVFLFVMLYLFGCDQNREQPWVYMYWVMLLLNLLPERVILPACRLALAFVYLWAGIQKLNGKFFSTIPAWFAHPAEDWNWPHPVVAALQFGIALTPFLEIFIGTGIWFRGTRWFAIVLAVTLHGASLLFLGPLGQDVNLVVWPWNIAMAALLVILFGARESASLPQTFSELCHSWGGALVLGLYGLLPVLSFFGWWDSYLSFSLYSGNLANADFYLTQSLAQRLPAQMQTYVYPTRDYNPAYQAPYMFEHVMWGTAVLGTPPLPEPRGYAAMFQYVSAYATNKDECWMLVQPRGGPIWIYRPGATNPVAFGNQSFSIP